MTQMSLVSPLGGAGGELRTRAKAGPGPPPLPGTPQSPSSYITWRERQGLRCKSHLEGTGEKGRGRGEGRLTKETSCCLHTNPKLIMRGGGGAEKCLGRNLCRLKSRPESLRPSLCHPPPWVLTTHTRLYICARDSDRGGQEEPVVVIWPLQPRAQILPLRPHTS